MFCLEVASPKTRTTHRYVLHTIGRLQQRINVLYKDVVSPINMKVCRNINQIKICMEAGRTVVLLNLDNLYESLYDLLNQVGASECILYC